jgi:hypothetical protein
MSTTRKSGALWAQIYRKSRQDIRTALIGVRKAARDPVHPEWGYPADGRKVNRSNGDLILSPSSLRLYCRIGTFGLDVILVIMSGYMNLHVLVGSME